MSKITAAEFDDLYKNKDEKTASQKLQLLPNYAIIDFARIWAKSNKLYLIKWVIVLRPDLQKYIATNFGVHILIEMFNSGKEYSCIMLLDLLPTMKSWAFAKSCTENNLKMFNWLYPEIKENSISDKDLQYIATRARKDIINKIIEKNLFADNLDKVFKFILQNKEISADEFYAQHKNKIILSSEMINYDMQPGNLTFLLEELMAQKITIKLDYGKILTIDDNCSFETIVKLHEYQPGVFTIDTPAEKWLKDLIDLPVIEFFLSILEVNKQNYFNNILLYARHVSNDWLERIYILVHEHISLDIDDVFNKVCNASDISKARWLCMHNSRYTIVSNVFGELIDWHIDDTPNVLSVELKFTNLTIDDITCSICLKSNSDVITNCQHTYCTKCIGRWYNIRQTCPNCRQTITEFEKIQKI